VRQQRGGSGGGGHAREISPADRHGADGATGKRTQVEQASGHGAPVQRRPSAAGSSDAAAPRIPGDAAGEVAAGAFAGAAREVPHRAQMEQAFGRSFAGVNAFTGPQAADASEALGADAFASGSNVAFHDASPDAKLVAHELTHVVQQAGGAPQVAAKATSSPGDASEAEADRVAERVAAGQSAGPITAAPTGAIARHPVGGKDTPIITAFPWIGRVTGTSSAALRSAPHKDAGDPHRTTIADLPRDTWVDVYAVTGGWYHVKATLDGKELDGWVSHELVAWVHEGSWDDVRKMPSFSESLVILKRAQTENQQGTKIAKPEQDQIDKAVEIVKRDPKYAVNETSYEVTFAKLGAGKKIQVVSIEDFILFVEDVERQYAGAKPAEIATEVRQLWFSDVNWDVLVDGDGVMDGGKPVDIETEPNPIAQKFDMKDLAPSAGGKKIATRLGTVDIGHVMAGIDAALNGGPAAYPKDRLQRRGEDNGKSKFKWETLKDGDGGNPRAFATWAGDLGQAYAVFISDVVVDGKTGTLADYVSSMAKPDEILGDIHGYIAHQVWHDTPSSEDPTGTKLSVSSILRDLYLMSRPGGKGDDGTYRAKFEKVSGKAGPELENFIWSEAFAFAEPWYVKVSLDKSYAAALDGYDELVREFNVQAGQHEDRNGNKNTLKGLVNDLLRKIEGTLDGGYTPI